MVKLMIVLMHQGGFNCFALESSESITNGYEVTNFLATNWGFLVSLAAQSEHFAF